MEGFNQAWQGKTESIWFWLTLELSLCRELTLLWQKGCPSAEGFVFPDMFLTVVLSGALNFTEHPGLIVSFVIVAFVVLGAIDGALVALLVRGLLLWPLELVLLSWSWGRVGILLPLVGSNFLRLRIFLLVDGVKLFGVIGLGFGWGQRESLIQGQALLVLQIKDPSEFSGKPRSEQVKNKVLTEALYAVVADLCQLMVWELVDGTWSWPGWPGWLGWPGWPSGIAYVATIDDGKSLVNPCKVIANWLVGFHGNVSQIIQNELVSRLHCKLGLDQRL